MNVINERADTLGGGPALALLRRISHHEAVAVWVAWALRRLSPTVVNGEEYGQDNPLIVLSRDDAAQ